MPALVAILLSLATILSVSCHAGETRTVRGVPFVEAKPGLWSRTTLSPDSALAIAIREFPSAEATKAELEEEDDALIFSIDLTLRGQPGIEEIHIDARTGAILKREHEAK